MKRLAYILILAALATGFASCTKEDIKEEPVYSSVLKPDFSFEEKEYVAGIDEIQFTNLSTAEGTEIVSYYWHYGFFGADSYSEEETPDAFVYTNPGNYEVKLTVYGKDGNKATVCKIVPISAKNAAPLVSFTVTPSSPAIGEEVTLVSTTKDIDGEMVSWSWVLPDGTMPDGETVKYTFTEKGYYDISLTVTDEDGDSATLDKSVFVRGDGAGSGTKEDPWIVDTADKWLTMAADMNKSTPSTYKADAYYIITANLNFSGKTFQRVNTFHGVLDGMGHKLSGISKKWTGNNDGVIGDNRGTVKNMTVEATWSLPANKYNLGVVGKNMEGGVIDGVFFKGNVSGGTCLGGVCGLNYGVVINSGCLGGKILMDTGAIADDHQGAGGVVGMNNGGFVVNCYSWVDEVKSEWDAGGVVGFGNGNGFIINCYSTCHKMSSIVKHPAGIGGIGYCYRHNVQNVYSVKADKPLNGSPKPVIGKIGEVGTTWGSYDWVLELSADNMRDGKVAVPSTGEECANFVEALNKGISIFNNWEDISKPEGLLLRAWVPSSTYPVLAE